MIADDVPLSHDAACQVGIPLYVLPNHEEGRLDVVPSQDIQNLDCVRAGTIVKGQGDDRPIHLPGGKDLAERLGARTLGQKEEDSKCHYHRPSA